MVSPQGVQIQACGSTSCLLLEKNAAHRNLSCDRLRDSSGHELEKRYRLNDAVNLQLKLFGPQIVNEPILVIENHHIRLNQPDTDMNRLGLWLCGSEWYGIAARNKHDKKAMARNIHVNDRPDAIIMSPSPYGVRFARPQCLRDFMT